MKRLYTFLAVAAVISMSSCSSSRNAQTTDDVYYSSGSKRTAAAADDNGKDEYYSTRPSDNYVRMKAEDQTRWSYFDDYGTYDSYYAPGYSYGMGLGYGYPSYGFGYGYGLGFGYSLWDPFFSWSSYWMWNSWYNPYFYNPYYGGAVYVTHGYGSSPAGVYSNLRPFNSIAYRNGVSATTRTTNSGSRFYRPGMATTSNYNRGLNNGQSSQGRPVNNSFYRPSNTTNNSNNGFSRPSFSQPTRSYTPSGGGGGGGGFSRPGRH